MFLKMNPILRNNSIKLIKNNYSIYNFRVLNYQNYCYLSRNVNYFDYRNQYFTNRLLVKSKFEYQPCLLLSTTSKKKTLLFTWKSFIISGVLVSIFAIVLLQMKNEKLKKMEKQRKKALGETSVGGKFDLIDQDGRPFTSYDLEGKWAMIYFGFTHCPDVCPDEMEKIVKAIDLISKNEDSDPIQPVFITVDPERDTVNVIREYIREFSPKFIGLTGTKKQVEEATRAYRVYYSVGPRDNENDYIVDHTIITYLINPEGRLVDYYGQTKTAEDVYKGVIKSMKNYRAANRRLGFL